MKTAIDKVTIFIMKNYDREKEKFESGVKHNFYNWEEILSSWKSFLESYLGEKDENNERNN